MIEFLVQLLSVDEFKGKSKHIDFAKGSHKLPLTIKEAWTQQKRKKAWQ